MEGKQNSYLEVHTELSQMSQHVCRQVLWELFPIKSTSIHLVLNTLGNKIKGIWWPGPLPTPLVMTFSHAVTGTTHRPRHVPGTGERPAQLADWRSRGEHSPWDPCTQEASGSYKALSLSCLPLLSWYTNSHSASPGLKGEQEQRETQSCSQAIFTGRKDRSREKFPH